MTTGYLRSLPLAYKSRNLSNSKYRATDSQSWLTFCHSYMVEWLKLISAASVMNALKQSCFMALSTRICWWSISYKHCSPLALPSFIEGASRKSETWAWWMSRGRPRGRSKGGEWGAHPPPPSQNIELWVNASTRHTLTNSFCSGKTERMLQGGRTGAAYYNTNSVCILV